MGLFSKIFSDDTPKLWEVHIRGTVHRNGPVPINHRFTTDNHLTAAAFLGAKRYDVIADWLHVNYPGATFNPRNFGVTVKSVKQERV